MMKHYVVHYLAESSDWKCVIEANSLMEVLKRTETWGKVVAIYEVGDCVWRDA